MRLSNKNPSTGLQINSVFKGVIWALIITIMLGVLLSIFLQYTPLSEVFLTGFSIFIFFISMLLGALISAHSAGCKGLFHGLSTSLVYFVLMTAAGLICVPTAISLGFAIKRFSLCLVSGVIGGIIGIGLSTK